VSHHSSIPPFQSLPFVRNKANLRGGELENKCLSNKGLREKVRTVRQ
jgi:hypothetical protein